MDTCAVALQLSGCLPAIKAYSLLHFAVSAAVSSHVLHRVLRCALLCHPAMSQPVLQCLLKGCSITPLTDQLRLPHVHANLGVTRTMPVRLSSKTGTAAL